MSRFGGLAQFVGLLADPRPRRGGLGFRGGPDPGGVPVRALLDLSGLRLGGRDDPGDLLAGGFEQLPDPRAARLLEFPDPAPRLGELALRRLRLLLEPAQVGHQPLQVRVGPARSVTVH